MYESQISDQANKIGSLEDNLKQQYKLQQKRLKGIKQIKDVNNLLREKNQKLEQANNDLQQRLNQKESEIKNLDDELKKLGINLSQS